MLNEKYRDHHYGMWLLTLPRIHSWECQLRKGSTCTVR